MHWVQNLIKKKTTTNSRSSNKKMSSNSKGTGGGAEKDGEGTNRCFGSRSNKRKIYRRGASANSRNRFYRKEMSSTEGESSFGSDLETYDSTTSSRRSRYLKSQAWRVENLRDAPPTKDEWWQECPWETVNGSYDETVGSYDMEHGYEHAYSYEETMYYDNDDDLNIQPSLSCSYDYAENDCIGFGVAIGNNNNGGGTASRTPAASRGGNSSSSIVCGTTSTVSPTSVIHETRACRKFHNCGYETWVRAREEWNKQTVHNVPPKPALSTSQMQNLVKGLGKATSQRTHELPRRMALSDVIDAYTVIWQGDDY